MTGRNVETPSGSNRDGALAGDSRAAQFPKRKNIITIQKIKEIMIESLLALAAIPADLLLLPLFFILAVARLFGRPTS